MKKILGVLVCLSLSGCLVTREGDKVGTVTKLAQQGIFVKTWEGQIIRGGLNGGNGGFGAVFNFTVEKPEVLAQLQLAMDKGQEVKIHYHKEAVTWLRSESCNSKDKDGVNGDCNYFVDSVTVITPQTATN